MTRIKAMFGWRPALADSLHNGVINNRTSPAMSARVVINWAVTARKQRLVQVFAMLVTRGYALNTYSRDDNGPYTGVTNTELASLRILQQRVAKPVGDVKVRIRQLLRYLYRSLVYMFTNSYIYIMYCLRRIRQRERLRTKHTQLCSYLYVETVAQRKSLECPLKQWGSIATHVSDGSRFDPYLSPVYITINNVTIWKEK